MSSEKERNFAYSLAVVCLAVGILCYGFLPAKSPDQPVRVHLSSVGGNVLFDHAAHSEEYQLSCVACHHEPFPDQPPITDSCASCHTDKDGSKVFGEEGSFDHDMHSMDLDLGCAECHHNYSEDEGDDPQSCSECHDQNSLEETGVSRMHVFHMQCIGCHEENGVSPGREDCSSCHHPRKEMDAFHDNCIGCHEEMGSGPVGEDSNCIYCHGY